MKATIRFRAKVETVYNMDDTPAYELIKVPRFERRHCEIAEFRRHPRFQAYVNSDLFPGVLNGIRKKVTTGDGYLRLDRIEQLPYGVSVDRSGFLATVTVTV
jgi:hypothetical protein